LYHRVKDVRPIAVLAGEAAPADGDQAVLRLRQVRFTFGKFPHLSQRNLCETTSRISSGVQMKFLRVLSRVLAALALACLGIAAAGATYNALSLKHLRNVAGVPGKLYNVNGYAMHLYCTGQGSPTIVLDAGLGDDSTVWAKVQPELSKVTRVCSYDRAGFGWSQPRPGVQDANAISAQLHQLVAVAGVQCPFLLMGTPSLASICVPTRHIIPTTLQDWSSWTALLRSRTIGCRPRW
jgi:hypothetical protein